MNNRQFKRSLKVLSDAGVTVRTIYTEALIADPDFLVGDYARPTCPEIAGVTFEYGDMALTLGNGESRFHAFETIAADMLNTAYELTEKARKQLISAMLVVGLGIVTYDD